MDRVISILKRKGFKEECPGRYYWTFFKFPFLVTLDFRYGISVFNFQTNKYFRKHNP